MLKHVHSEGPFNYILVVLSLLAGDSCSSYSSQEAHLVS
jgi:hypothetical protein